MARAVAYFLPSQCYLDVSYCGVYCLYQFGTVFTQNLMCIVKQNIKTDKQLNVYGTAISKTDVHFQHILLQYILLKILMQNDR